MGQIHKIDEDKEIEDGDDTSTKRKEKKEKYKRYNNNPSIDGFENYIKKIGRGKENITTIEDEGRVTYKIPIRKDKRKYSKFIMYEGWLYSILKLSKTSIALIFYILDNMKIGKTIIKLDGEDFRNITNITRPTYYKALYQLLDNEWIYKTKTSKNYYINIRKFFRGPAELIYRDMEIKKQRDLNMGRSLDVLEEY